MSDMTTSAGEATQRGSRPRRATDVEVELPNVGTVRVIQAKAANVVKHLGGPTATARILKVAKSQPGRWVKGSELPSPSSTRHVLDLDYVLSRLEQLYDPATARTWLSSPNSYLGGAQPLDVLLLDGPTDVIAAIDASMAGSYA